MASQTDMCDRVSCLFGTPIAHTLSPLIHQAVYRRLGLRWKYFLLESTSIPAFLAFAGQPKFFGAAVTMPHKVAIIPHLDELTPEGRAVGAVNTVFLREDGRGRRLLVGTNTDTVGVREGIRQNVSPAMYAGFRGRPGLIIGGGGTSRAAVYALKHSLGCDSVYFINRDAAEVAQVIGECTRAGFGDGLVHVLDAAHAAALEPPAVIVSAVPNFPPVTAAERVARACVEVMLGRARGALLEMCYHPTSDTEIKRLAETAGWLVVPGTEAMIWQGLEQNVYWTGRPIADMPVQELKGIIKQALERPH
ncbi:protein of unknown function [Taphrina deformans PYCC 5710]|uniref:Shikimate dehydrogenase substrate binding N-terminal domain-containing protein n=1 Tax=Taphrina deformans (strain PYCC 5710 / ATCC 11124 / CBS 356.35 / IMI 108563 / JCM 9778 / NBRC 8474) TaxID=1097556 RepID=R4XF96_TAPDE|nr:protein of unknown function [Taphrina deformans PYCC 5710]|eukprot:CCG84456.1 protein of unknown function [Taphrina deformans PYCC 5710]